MFDMKKIPVSADTIEPAAHLEPCHRNPDTLAKVSYIDESDCVVQLNYGEKCIHAGQRCHRSNGLVATVLDF